MYMKHKVFICTCLNLMRTSLAQVLTLVNDSKSNFTNSTIAVAFMAFISSIASLALLELLHAKITSQPCFANDFAVSKPRWKAEHLTFVTQSMESMCTYM